MSVVERCQHIAATPERILPLITSLRRWQEWSPWEGLDDDLRPTYTGPEFGVGSSYAWKGNRSAGAGTMTVVLATDDAVDVQVDFTKPFPSRSVSSFRVLGQCAETRVTWSMTTPDTFLTRIASKVMNFDKRLGNDIEKDLAGLAVAATR